MCTSSPKNVFCVELNLVFSWLKALLLCRVSYPVIYFYCTSSSSEILLNYALLLDPSCLLGNMTLHFRKSLIWKTMMTNYGNQFRYKRGRTWINHTRSNQLNIFNYKLGTSYIYDQNIEGSFTGNQYGNTQICEILKL